MFFSAKPEAIPNNCCRCSLLEFKISLGNFFSVASSCTSSKNHFLTQNFEQVVTSKLTVDIDNMILVLNCFGQINNHSGTQTKSSVIIVTTFLCVYVKLITISIFRISPHPHLYPILLLVYQASIGEIPTVREKQSWLR